MNGKASFRDSSKGNVDNGADALNRSVSPAPGSCGDEIPSAPQPAKVYGPAPKPVPQPAIFSKIYNPSEGDSTAASCPIVAPSFNLADQSNASVSESSFQTVARESQPEFAVGSPVQESLLEEGAEVSQTISVESQSDSPSLNDLVGIDVSEASREELMVYHSELMGWIRELDQALQDCQSDFKSHLQLYGQQEQLLEQRTQELLALQERHGALNQEVDVQQKAHQRQTILVETLQDQLDSSQERVAQMERDFSQVQRRCSDQAQQLLQAEGLCRDLKSRLGRQQRHTMQFKAALEKSLAVSVSDSDYDLGDMDMDSMDSSGELFPRPKPVQPWSNQLDEAALSQVLNNLDSADSLEQPAVTKGLNLQLAFENPEAVDSKAVEVKAAAKAQMAYGSAAMGLAASQTLGMNDPVEPVFDPEQAKDLEASLKQESESILQGEFLRDSASAGPTRGRPDQQTPLVNNHTVAFVPPITPMLPEEAAEQRESLNEVEPAKEAAAVKASEDDAELASSSEKKRTTLAGISLPNFPKF